MTSVWKYETKVVKHSHVAFVESAPRVFQLKEKNDLIFWELYWLGMWWCWRSAFCFIHKKEKFLEVICQTWVFPVFYKTSRWYLQENSIFLICKNSQEENIWESCSWFQCETWQEKILPAKIRAYLLHLALILFHYAIRTWNIYWMLPRDGQSSPLNSFL